MGVSTQMLKVVFFILILFLTGCRDHTFTRIYQQDAVSHIDAIAISVVSQKRYELDSVFLKSLDIRIDKDADYMLEIDSSAYAKHCNNPLTPVHDALYDGYVKLTLRKGLKRVYVIQRDFKGLFDKQMIESLVDVMKDDMELNPN